MKYILQGLFEEPLTPVATLLLICCQAVNGNAKDAVPVSAVRSPIL
ncbi:MAG: hypothetical protein ACK4WN_11170 [Aphanizomenon sp.]